MRLEADELRAIDALASRLNMTRAKVARHALRRAAGFFDPDDELVGAARAIMVELKRIGTNLNQLTYHANRRALLVRPRRDLWTRPGHHCGHAQRGRRGGLVDWPIDRDTSPRPQGHDRASLAGKRIVATHRVASVGTLPSARIKDIVGLDFDAGWLPKQRKRVASGARAAGRLAGNARPRTPQAVFKIIRSGACFNRADLKAQMNYVLGKADHIVDPNIRHDGRSELTSRQVSRLATEWSEGWRGKIENGNTMHMVMSFPKGSDLVKVSTIVRAVTEDLLGQGTGRWNYIVGIHTDRDHPHAHIIVDRRNDENELFYFSKNGEFTYDRFKDAMVDYGRQVGIEMMNTSRLSRGLVNQPYSDIDLRNTTRGVLLEHGKAPLEQ